MTRQKGQLPNSRGMAIHIRTDSLSSSVKQKSHAEKPERTREHYIEALSRSHVERFIILCGHTVDEPQADYGYDLVVTTFDYKGDPKFESGEIEEDSIYIQLKATDHLNTLKTDPAQIAFKIKRRHAMHWVKATMPVILIVYSVPDDEAYWLHIQPYLKSVNFIMPPKTQEEFTVHLSKANIVNEAAIEKFRKIKTDSLKRIEGLHLYG